MFTSSLFKHFLTFSLFAVLLLPQMSASGSALAKKPTATPIHRPVTHTKKSVAKPVIKAIPNLNCLDVSLSTIFSDGVIPVASPPGQAVTFEISLYVANNCTTTVTGVSVTGTVNIACPVGSSDMTPAGGNSVQIPGSIDPTKTGDAQGNGQGRCIISTDGIPTASIVPTSMSIDIAANGTDGFGETVRALQVNLPITWSPTAKRL